MNSLGWKFACILSLSGVKLKTEHIVDETMRIFKGIVMLYWLVGTASAQPGWGPDSQITNTGGSTFSPRISSSGSMLHVVFWQAGRDSLGSYEDVFYIRSTDSGAHWSDTLRLSPRDNKSDVGPSMVADFNDVHVVWCWISGGVSHCRSTDGGITWGGIDTAVIRDGIQPCLALAGDTLYVVAIDGARGTTVFRRSTNRGATWFPVQDLGPGWQRPQIFVQKNLVHVFTEVELPQAAEVAYSRSTEGGLSWTPMIYLSSDDSLNSAWPSLTGEDSLNLFLVWMDGKYSPYSWTGDIFLRRSTDGGTSWAPEESLTVEHRAHASDILAQGDTLHMVWEDERVDPGKNFELFYRMSTDRGVSWGSEVRLTYAPGNSYGPRLSLSSDLLHLVWYDYRNDTTSVKSEVYYKQKTLFPSGVEMVSSTVNQFKCRVEISPNPIRTSCEVSLDGVEVETASLYDVLGRVVRTFPSHTLRLTPRKIRWDGRDEKGKEVKSGIYFLTLSSDKRTFTTKIVVVR